MHKKHILSNQLPIVYQEMAGYQSVSVGIWIKVGSINETAHNNGISHFIEHMLFKGTEKRDAKQIAYDIDRFGGEINAFTTRECICVYAKVLSKDLKDMLEVLSDMVLHSRFDASIMSVEKGIVMDEISMYEDSPEDLVDDLSMQVAFSKHALSLPVLGLKETVSKLTQKQVIDYYHQYFVPENMLVSVAGHFDENQLFEWSETFFNFPQRQHSLKPKEIDQPKHCYEAAHLYKDNEQIQVSIDFKGLPYHDDHDYDLMLFASLLGGTNSSRLFQSLREEKGLVYAIDTSAVFYETLGTLNISFGVSKENMESAIETLAKELRKLVISGVSEEEFKAAKSHLKGSTILSLEATDDYMDFIGHVELFGQKEKDIEAIIEKIDHLNLDDCRSMIHKTIKSQQFSMAIVGDIDEKSTKKYYQKMKMILDENR